MTGVQASLREANRTLVLDAVRRYGGLTQVELAGATGLSPATVSNIVRDLLAVGAVTTRGTVRNGRRAVMVGLPRRSGLVAGVHIGARHLEVVLCDATYEILEHRVMPLVHEHRPDTTLDHAALLVVEMLRRVDAKFEDLIGLGVGLPSVVDPDTGRVVVAGLLRGWDDVPLAETLEARMRRPVFAENDANLGALAELRRGAGREQQDLVYVRISHGTGAGIVIGGNVYRGFAGTAGEIGHVRVTAGGDVCRCGGRGCLDTVVGGRALVAPLVASHGSLTLRDVVDGAVAGDPGCSQVVADAGAIVGDVVANLVVALNVPLVVVGGELARTGELLVDPIRTAVRQRMPAQVASRPRVQAAELGQSAETTGAVSLVLASTAPTVAVTGSEDTSLAAVAR